MTLRQFPGRTRAVMIAAALAIPFSASPILTTPASAQWIVYDPTNYAQNLLSATRALQQINNQITSLQNEAQMLINQARNLASLPYSSLQQLQQSVSRTQQLLGQAQNIAYNVQAIDQAFQTQYANVSMSASDAQLVSDAKTRWQNTVGGLQDAMRVQATVVGNIDTNRTEMSSLLAPASLPLALCKQPRPETSSWPSGPATERSHGGRCRQWAGAGFAIGRTGRRCRTGARTTPPLPDAGFRLSGWQCSNVLRQLRAA